MKDKFALGKKKNNGCDGRGLSPPASSSALRVLHAVHAVHAVGKAAARLGTGRPRLAARSV